MDEEVYQVAETKEDHRPQHQDSGTGAVIQPFIIRASDENDEENGQSAALTSGITLDFIENPCADGRAITSQLIYGVEDVPPSHVSFFLGFQVRIYFK